MDAGVMSSQALTPKHVSFFMYQILRGIKYLHSIKVHPPTVSERVLY